MIFRRLPFLNLPDSKSALGAALAAFKNDADMLGTPLVNYAKNVVNEVICVGRAGTLVDWESTVENRAYASMYAAEDILNWRVERVNGRNIPTLIVLHERCGAAPSGGKDEDPFVTGVCERIRVLKLVRDVPGESPATTGVSPVLPMRCEVEIWDRVQVKGKRDKVEWELTETRVPLRLGKPLPLIPFVFHGSLHSQPCVEKLPLADIIAVNLDHYRLDADYKHGIHFTALPTAWVSGFDKAAALRIGSSTAWVTETPGATAGFLEFHGQGLGTFERAMDRDERLLAVLGSRLLERTRKVAEAAQSMELRHSWENSILGSIALNVGVSLTQVLRWVYWWNSTEAMPDDVTSEQVRIELNSDFGSKGLTAAEINSIVQAWQASAISRDSMTELFRRGEVLPEGRNTVEEEALLASEGTGVPATALARGGKTGLVEKQKLRP